MRIAVIGLGYVGLPLTVELATHYPGVVGYDIDAERIRELQGGVDRLAEISSAELDGVALTLSSDASCLAGIDVYIVAVPTPVTASKEPDLSHLIAASESIGRYMDVGAIIVYESTVYPGAVETVCRQALARTSGLPPGRGFKVAYSPERVSPGKSGKRLTEIVKLVSAEDTESLDVVSSIYERIIPAGVYRTSSIRVAEAAKVIENTQRDLNIALMNELALIFDRVGLSTTEVLSAAATKWNFVSFAPGFVGGHCISVDPYYLTSLANAHGYEPQVILAGRRVNDQIPLYVARKMVKMLVWAGKPVPSATVGVLGFAFKEDVPDIRNTRVLDVVRELADYGVIARVHDPLVNNQAVLDSYGIKLCRREELQNLDGLILAVPHDEFVRLGITGVAEMLVDGGVLIDVKGVFHDQTKVPNISYWTL